MKALVLVLVLAAGAALAAMGGLPPLALKTSETVTFTNCAAGGSSSSATKALTYLVRTFDEDVFICYAATCAAGGERFTKDTILLLRFENATTLSCRSAGATGDIVMTAARVY